MVQSLFSKLKQLAMEVENEKERTIALRVRLYKERMSYKKNQGNLKSLMDAKQHELNDLSNTLNSLTKTKR